MAQKFLNYQSILIWWMVMIQILLFMGDIHVGVVMASKKHKMEPIIKPGQRAIANYQKVDWHSEGDRLLGGNIQGSINANQKRKKKNKKCGCCFCRSSSSSSPRLQFKGASDSE